MLSPGPARKVTIHLNDDTPSTRSFLYAEIFDFLFQQGIAGATMLRPEAGFGSHHRIHGRSDSPRGAEHMPVRIEFTESIEKVEQILPALCAMVSDGLVEAHDTTIYRSASGRETL